MEGEWGEKERSPLVRKQFQDLRIAMLYWGASATEPLIPPAVTVHSFSPHLCIGHGLAAMLHFLAPFGPDWIIPFMQPM